MTSFRTRNDFRVLTWLNLPQIAIIISFIKIGPISDISVISLPHSACTDGMVYRLARDAQALFFFPAFYGRVGIMTMVPANFDIPLNITNQHCGWCAYANHDIKLAGFFSNNTRLPRCLTSLWIQSWSLKVKSMIMVSCQDFVTKGVSSSRDVDISGALRFRKQMAPSRPVRNHVSLSLDRCGSIIWFGFVPVILLNILWFIPFFFFAFIQLLTQLPHSFTVTGVLDFTSALFVASFSSTIPSKQVSL